MQDQIQIENEFEILDVNVRRLEVGEILKETDFYLSTSGSWQPIPGPIVGNQVLDNNVEFAREEPWK